MATQTELIRNWLQDRGATEVELIDANCLFTSDEIGDYDVISDVSLQFFTFNGIDSVFLETYHGSPVAMYLDGEDQTLSALRYKMPDPTEKSREELTDELEDERKKLTIGATLRRPDLVDTKHLVSAIRYLNIFHAEDTEYVKSYAEHQSDIDSQLRFEMGMESELQNDMLTLVGYQVKEVYYMTVNDVMGVLEQLSTCKDDVNGWRIYSLITFKMSDVDDKVIIIYPTQLSEYKTRLYGISLDLEIGSNIETKYAVDDNVISRIINEAVLIEMDGRIATRLRHLNRNLTISAMSTDDLLNLVSMK